MNAPVDWRNFDASPTLRFERIPLIGRLYTRNAARFPRNAECGDICRGLPVEGGSCDAIYCSHVLEHLSFQDCYLALRNTYAMLKPGGIFRLVVPDFAYHVGTYLKQGDADQFLRETRLGRERRPRRLAEMVVAMLSSSAHLWMWDEENMRQALRNVGFAGLRRAVFGDSKEPAFALVERRERWENCLGMECLKPQALGANDAAWS